MIEFICGVTAGIILTKKIKALEKINLPKLPKYKVIVKINDDNYAIRKGYLYYEYKDLKDSFWWTKNSTHFHYCLGSKEEVLKKFVPVIKSEIVIDL
jgi:hypothetical protein